MRVPCIPPKFMDIELEIEQAKTQAGGWTRAQLATWGVPWPPPKGWKKNLIQERRSAARTTVSKTVNESSSLSAPASLCQQDDGAWQPKKAVNPTDAVCAKCGDGYGAPSHNDRNWASHEFVKGGVGRPVRQMASNHRLAGSIPAPRSIVCVCWVCTHGSRCANPGSMRTGVEVESLTICDNCKRVLFPVDLFGNVIAFRGLYGECCHVDSIGRTSLRNERV